MSQCGTAGEIPLRSGDKRTSAQKTRVSTLRGVGSLARATILNGSGSARGFRLRYAALSTLCEAN